MQANLIAAVVPPTETHDETKGYRALSLWYDQVEEAFYKCLDATENLAVWKKLSSGEFPLEEEWDLIVGGEDGAAERLAVGAEGQVLTVNEDDEIEWADPAFINPMEDEGDLIVGGEDGEPTKLPVGSEGQILTVGEDDTIEWATPDLPYIEKLEGSLNLLVGAGEDYETINEALTFLMSKRPTVGDVTAVITLKAGYIMKEPVKVENGLDLSWVTISGADPVTTISAIDLDGEDAAFLARNGSKLPKIDQKFAIDDSGSIGMGLAAITNSSVIVEVNRGVTNPQGVALYAGNHSFIDANSADFSSSATGIVAEEGSTINANNANISNCTSEGVVCSGGSSIYAMSANISAGANQPELAIVADAGGYVNAFYATLTGSVDGVYVASNATVDLTSADIRRGADPDPGDITLEGGTPRTHSIRRTWRNIYNLHED